MSEEGVKLPGLLSNEIKRLQTPVGAFRAELIKVVPELKRLPPEQLAAALPETIRRCGRLARKETDKQTTGGNNERGV